MSQNSNIPETVAKRLKIARENSGLSQAQVAREMKLHRPTISEIEAARRQVSVREAKDFADIYGVSIEWLLDIDQNKNDLDARLELAARELSKMKSGDLDKVMNLLKTLKKVQGES